MCPHPRQHRVTAPGIAAEEDTFVDAGNHRYQFSKRMVVGLVCAEDLPPPALSQVK
jgi:hypothetical protein